MVSLGTQPACVLVLGIGGPTPMAIARSLTNHSETDYRIVGADCDPQATGFYQSYVDEVEWIDPADSDDYWDDLSRVVDAYDVDACIVSSEPEVKAWASQAQWPAPSLVPPAPYVDVLQNKARMNDCLAGTEFIPRSLSLHASEIDTERIADRIGYPCWVRSATGSSGSGSLKVESPDQLRAWLRLNDETEYTVSEYLPGRNLAVKCLYVNGSLLRAGCAQRVEYLMSDVAPSGITGNTSFGRLLNEPELVHFVDDAMQYLGDELVTEPHGFVTADLKEDSNGDPKITEINTRHVAFTSSFAAAGANLAEEMLSVIRGDTSAVSATQIHEFDDDYVFIRDVDNPPVVVPESELV